MAGGTAWFRTEGGALMQFDVPLAGVFAEQARRGELVEAPAPEPAVDSERPADRAPKSDWTAYAVAQGADPGDAEDMTRAELIDRYGDEQP